MAHLNELPPCLLVSIFSYLPIGEVIRLKLVCKAWQETSAFVRFKSLSFYRYDYEEQSFTKPERLLENYDLYINDFEKFFRSTGPMVSGVQHLVLCLYDHPVNYENHRLEKFLHRFQVLEELELNVLPVDSLDLHRFFNRIHRTFTLELNRLRKLHLDCRWTDWARELTFELNCSQLSYLNTEKIENCRIRYPEKLRTLLLKLASNRTDFRKFVNLKNLIIDNGCDIHWLTQAFVARLPESLKRFIFFTWVRFQDLEDHLLKSYAIDQEHPSLRIFFQGIEVRLSQFPTDERPWWGEFEFMVANLADSVDANPCLNYSIDYNTIEELPTFDLFYKKMHPDCLCSSIIIDQRVADEDRLLEFLKRMRPSLLEFQDVYPRPFFDRLAEIQVNELHFRASDLGSEPGALDFLLRMSGLKSVTVRNCSLALTECLDFMITAFKRIRSLDYFQFDWRPSFSFSFSLTHSFSLNLWYIDETGRRRNMYRSCKAEMFGHKNKLDVLRYLIARLKQNSRLRNPNSQSNQLRDQLEFLFLIDELKHQAQPGNSVIKAIENYTKAIPIYL